MSRTSLAGPVGLAAVVAILVAAVVAAIAVVKIGIGRRG